jgi:hydrogenase nickel incorporation protein HypA/HybF
MHEWALAEGVVSTATKIAEEQGIIKVTEVTIKIGELQQVEGEILKFALEQLRTPILMDARFVLKEVPGMLKCRICSHDWKFKPREFSEEVSEAIHFLPEVAHVYVKCPKCGSPDFQVVEGRGVILASVKGVKKGE